jgi:hypothetical protein
MLVAMAIAIHLLRENRDPAETASDVHDLVDRIAAERRGTILASADPYGDTVGRKAMSTASSRNGTQLRSS